MPIETICQNCARKLRVDDEFAGRKARCPHCKHVYTVPQSLGPQTSRSTTPVATGQQWRLRTEDGSVYGPVGKAEIDIWLTEGRITAASHLQRDGSLEWLPAGKVYPALDQPVTQPTSSNSNPFADAAQANTNPYSTPQTISPIIRPRRFPPHRGGTILAFGVMGLFCCIVFAPIAWAMGHTDLKQIREGRMDPAGRGMTQIGMVLGIIGTVILGLQVVFGAIGVMAN